MSNNREWLRTGAQFMVLALVNEVDRYGYEMIQELEKRSDYTFEMKEGTLYPILHRMEHAGYLTSYLQKASNGKERKYYTITKLGKKQLIEEEKAWQQFSKSMHQVVMMPQLKHGT